MASCLRVTAFSSCTASKRRHCLDPSNQLLAARQKAMGTILPKPHQVRFGLLKITVTVAAFLCGGALTARELASWLEEFELYVPDQDED